jgi:hypothetical protein
MATDGKENPADGLLGPVIKRRIAKASRIVQPIQRTNWPNSWSSSDHVAAGVLLFISGSLPLRLSLRIDAVSIGLIGQLGPDSLPVVRAKFLPSHLAFGGLLDEGAMLRRDSPALEPCGNSRLNDSAALSQCALGTDNLNCFR